MYSALIVLTLHVSYSSIVTTKFFWCFLTIHFHGNKCVHYNKFIKPSIDRCEITVFVFFPFWYMTSYQQWFAKNFTDSFRATATKFYGRRFIITDFFRKTLRYPPNGMKWMEKKNTKCAWFLVQGFNVYLTNAIGINTIVLISSVFV